MFSNVQLKKVKEGKREPIKEIILFQKGTFLKNFSFINSNCRRAWPGRNLPDFDRNHRRCKIPGKTILQFPKLCCLWRLLLYRPQRKPTGTSRLLKAAIKI